MSYSKLHSSLVNSSLWTEPDDVRILFITLLAMCDRQGYVYGSRPGIERSANIDPDSDAWTVLMSPDSNSSDRLRNPEHEGRRIEEVPGGFKLLNFEYYRGLRNDDERREQTRLAQERHRRKHRSARVSQSKPRVSGDKPASSKVIQREQIPSASASVSASGLEEKKREEGECEGKAKADSIEEVLAFVKEIGLPKTDAEWFWHKCEANGWMNGNYRIRDWKQTLRSWKSGGYVPSIKNPRKGMTPPAEIKQHRPQPDGWPEWLKAKYPEAKLKDFWLVTDEVRKEFSQKIL